MVRETKSAGGVVQNVEGKVLVVSQHGNSWSLPKGHIEIGEDALTAAKREIQEESGVKNLTLIKEFPSYTRARISKDGKGEEVSEQKTIYFFLFETDEKILKPVDPENPEARWVEKENVSDLLSHPKDKEFFERILPELK